MSEMTLDYSQVFSTSSAEQMSFKQTFRRDLFYMKTSQYLSNEDLVPDKSYIYMCFPRLIKKGDLTYLTMEHSVRYST